MSRIVPSTLREREQWVCWNLECRTCGYEPPDDWDKDEDGEDCPEGDGRISKVPINAENGRNAKSSDRNGNMDKARATWTDYDTAREYHRDGERSTDGVGFVFDPDGLLAGVDLDDCRNPETGEIDPWATEVVDRLDSFTEVSPSGTGLHIYVLGFVPDGGHKAGVGDGEIEIYDEGRYFTVTGEHVDGTAEDVEQRNSTLSDIHADFVADDDRSDTGDVALESFEEPDDNPDSEFTLYGHGIEELRDADPTIDALLSEPNPGTRNDTSRSDFETCVRLLHFGYEPTDVGGIMRRYRNRSKLLEDRGDVTYLERTVREAARELTGDATEPVIEPDRGDVDKLCLWKIRQAAVAHGVLPPTAFVERETEDGDDYLGFPGRNSYSRTLAALEDAGIEHGRGDGGYTTDGGATTANAGGGNGLPESDTYDLSGEQLKIVLGEDDDADLGSIPANRLANGIEQILRDRDVHLRLLDTVDSKDQPIYSMDEDTMVWRQKGARRVAKLCRKILEYDNSKKAQRETVNALRASPSDKWLLKRDRLGVETGELTVQGGVLDLKERDTRPAKPQDYLQGRLPVEFDPEFGIDGTRFEEFLIGSVDPQDLDKLQEYAGYTLLKNAQPYKKALFLVGPTDSGKGTFLKTLEMILGDENVASETLYNLVNTRWGTHSIYGNMVNVSNEVSPSGLGNVGQFKMLTGGEDKVPAEDKGVSKYRFTVTQKFLFATNEFPQVEDADEAFYNRLLFVKFPHTVPDEEQEDLRTKFRWERSAILNWMLDGLDRLRKNGGVFTGERSINDKKEITKAFGSTVEQFAHAALDVTGDSEHVIHKKELYSAFTRYCDYINEDTPTQTKFTRELKEEAGVSDGKSERVHPDGNQKDVFKGARLNEDLFAKIQADLPAHSYERDDGGQQSLT